MPLTPEQAADIARQHGLGLDAAVSLRLLADTPEQATSLAAKFGRPVDLDESFRAKAAQLADLHRRTDRNGNIRPLNPVTDPTTPVPVPATLRPAGSTTAPGPGPSIAEQVAAAERSGDLATAARLKSEWVGQIRAEQEGQA